MEATVPKNIDLEISCQGSAKRNLIDDQTYLNELTESVNQHTDASDQQSDFTDQQANLTSHQTDLTDKQINLSDHQTDSTNQQIDFSKSQANSTRQQINSTDQKTRSTNQSIDSVQEGEKIFYVESTNASNSNSSDDRTFSRSHRSTNEMLMVTPSTSGISPLRPNFPQLSSLHYDANRASSVDESQDGTPTASYNEFSDFRPVISNSVVVIPVDNVQPRSANTDSEGEDVPRFGYFEEEVNERAEDDTSSYDSNENNATAVELKERPQHNFFLMKEVLNRELGISFPHGNTTNNKSTLQQRFYSSLHAVYRMEKINDLKKHTRCVQSINFHPQGKLLASGSDDAYVIIWDWARKKPLHIIESVHNSKIYQVKFLHLTLSSQFDIVTSSHDGCVNLFQCSNAGGTWSRRRLATHTKSAVSLYVTPLEPQSVLSAGQDGLIYHCDLRTDAINSILNMKQGETPTPVQSVHGHPQDPIMILVAPRDVFVRLYDRRNMSKPVVKYCPTMFTEEPNMIKRTIHLPKLSLSCAVYNHDGNEILASYSYDSIYMFDTKNDIFESDQDIISRKKGYSKRYSGHLNTFPTKGVSIYGPKSEYILSGSDCGHIFIWEKQTESIVQWLHADLHGVVHAVEAHPRIPILASCGMDRTVKLWAPRSREDPSFAGLETAVRRNVSADWQGPMYSNIPPVLYRLPDADDYYDGEEPPSSQDFEANNCTVT